MNRVSGDVKKSVIITGCSSGIGRATAKEARARGYKVIGLDINKPVDGLVDTFIQGDLSSQGGIADAKRKLSEAVTFNADEAIYLVNNAGIQDQRFNALHMPTEIAEKIDNVCRKAPVELCHWFIKSIEKLGRNPVDASIVNIGSIQAVSGIYGNSSTYNIAKQAVHGITRAFGDAAAQDGIQVRINTVHPGCIATEGMGKVTNPADLTPIRKSTPMGRRGSPEEMAEEILNTLRATFRNMSELLVDGGIAERSVRPEGYKQQTFAKGVDPDADIVLAA